MSEIQTISPLDVVEARIVQLGGAIRERGTDLDITPTKHRFTPGLYIRELFMPAGYLITGEKHRTEHPYVVLRGRALVYNELTAQWDTIQAPHFGITKPGARRLLIIVHDMIWATFHVTPHTDVETIENEIFDRRANPLIALVRGGAE